MAIQNLTNKELKFSYWYVTNKLLLRQWFIGFLIALAAILWFFVLWQLIFYFIQYEVERAQIRRLLFGENKILSTLESRGPLPLKISDLKILTSENNRYDFMSQVINVNPLWLATFDYQFATNNNTGFIRQGFVLPGEEKYLMDLGFSESGARLEISNLKWQRFGDFEKKYNDRFRLTVTNEDFIAAQSVSEPNRLVFDLTNHSAFNYWAVGAQAFLMSNGNIVSVNYITLEKLKSGETRPVEMYWNNRLPRVNRMQVVVDINILDDKNIMPPESPAGEYR